jgi:hypothetical protein
LAEGHSGGKGRLLAPEMQRSWKQPSPFRQRLRSDIGWSTVYDMEGYRPPASLFRAETEMFRESFAQSGLA